MLRAIFYALRHSAEYEPVEQFWGRITGFFSIVFSKRVPLTITEERLAACGKCPLFCKELRTCGDARRPEYWNDPEDGQRKAMGCHCYLPMKARLSEATCWLDDHSFSDRGPNWPR